MASDSISVPSGVPLEGRRRAVRPWLRDAVPYRAGQKATTPEGSLASNEVGRPSEKAIAALVQAAQEVNRYPDPLASKVRSRLAACHDVPVEQVLVGSGSDELLFLLAAAYAGVGGRVVCADPPYWGHEHPPRMTGAEVVKVPLVDWAHDLDAMAAVDCDIAFVCNPHNPTGTIVDAERLAAFTRESSASLVVLDEAYIDFADDPTAGSAVHLARRGDAVVLRTFSKLYGLAGARIGYLIGPPDVVDALVRLRAPFSVNALAQAAALAALDDPEHTDAMRAETNALRARLRQTFAAAGYESVPSQANFVLVLCPDEEDLVRRLAAHGVRVRAGRDLGLPGSLRVTVPSEAGLAMLEDALR